MLKEIFKELLKEELSGKTESAPPWSGLNHPYTIGCAYHIRTVTMAIAGILTAVHEHELVFSNASWVADTGRFNEYLKDTSKLKENEPFKYNAIVGRGALIDCTRIDDVYTSVK